MGRMQKKKGDRFQNLVNNILSSALGVQVVTNPSQYGKDAGRDHLIPLPLCLQSQHAKRPDVWKKLKEARDSAYEGEFPVAILRKDYQPIIVAMYIEDWLELVREFYL